MSKTVSRDGNALLRGLSDADFALLEPSLTLVDLTRGEEFSRPEGRVPFSWFPIAGLASVIATTGGGKQAEVGIVGRDGMFATSTIYGLDWSMMHILCQVSGRALRLPEGVLRAAMQQSATLRARLLAYAYAFTVQVSASALAFAVDTIEVRLARWLVMSHDRLGVPDIALTHESLARMLGVRRAGVTVALQHLESRGAIRGRRAAITIIDRGLLIDLANSSYGVAEAAYRRALGTPPTGDGVDSGGGIASEGLPG